MTVELPVHISREELHTLEVPASFETTGSFDIRLVNHGTSLHVHLHLDDDLSEIATVGAGNHYVEGESERNVRVDVDTERLDGEQWLGKLKIVSAYGAETRWVDVAVSEPEPENESVLVDESLAQPQPEPEEKTVFDRPELPVLVLGGIALLVAVVTALVLEETVVLLGSLVVLGGVLVALFFLLSDR